jgi:2-polyprenyl-6-hydroxyphenyl methylase/3-demethylubiquinone-9 3-methyltransferase
MMEKSPPLNDAVTAGTSRFAFGRNWRKYLATLTEERVESAKSSLRELLNTDTLSGRSFVDVGCGSGLFSLAAWQLGASPVHSFDYDLDSVSTAFLLKSNYVSKDEAWTISRGSILDKEYLETLEQFDIVYSWGVLHHTGDMWQALDNVRSLVNESGVLVTAIYNDQGRASRTWLRVKRMYNRLPSNLRFIVLYPAFIRLWGPTLLRDALRGRLLHHWTNYDRARGMSPWRDVVDWVGGYPSEVAKREKVLAYFSSRGFHLRSLNSAGSGHGCNEFVFVRSDNIKR